MKTIASPAAPPARPAWDDPQTVRRALTIRRVEEAFLELFSAGRLNGTVHTSLGQEYSALAFAGAALEGDWIVSNHRCHGHFLASPYGDVRGLIAELMGKETGVCRGIGSSQHLFRGRFLSNGVQGGIVPVAAGLAYAERERSQAIALVFIGDGTLGEGAVYEALNLAALWSLPLVVVCEDNGIAQTTPREAALAGTIAGRGAAFGIRTWSATTDDPGALFAVADEALAYARGERAPALVHVRTRRLGPHSKGDDTREPVAIALDRARDPLAGLLASNPQFADLANRIAAEVAAVVAEVDGDAELPPERYLRTEPMPAERSWRAAEGYAGRTVERVNAFFHEVMAADPRVRFLGEDVLSPYGGAFKAAKDLSAAFPERVLTTPISEAAIVGVACGAALAGLRPYAEIMFGDFATLAFDQLVNHAAKFRDMYAEGVRCPLVVRLPMGGRRGYGPTHSQTLDKALAGIDGLRVVAVSRALDPLALYGDVAACDDPVVVIENKTDYGKPALAVPRGYALELADGPFPAARLRPLEEDPSVTIVAYGGALDVAVSALEGLFVELEEYAEIVVPGSLRPLDIVPVLASAARTGALVTLEEGSAPYGIGAEIVARVCEALPGTRVARVAAAPVAVPSAKGLEAAVLPQAEAVVAAVARLRA